MSKATAQTFQPRKKPVQERSTATVEAILQAAIQVLLSDGARLTTTRVAARAGVSVGTLYQYFPNKSSLLQTILREHLDGVAAAVESACNSMHGETLDTMAEAMIAAFVQAKFRNIDASAALYAISDDVEGKRIAEAMHARIIAAVAAMLMTASDASFKTPMLVAQMLLYAMAGVSRALLEQGPKRGAMSLLHAELTMLARAYLKSSAGPREPSAPPHRLA